MTTIKICIVAVTFLLCVSSEAWVSPSSLPRIASTRLWDTDQEDFSPLVLSANDLERLSQLRARQKTLPLLLGQSSLLPGQVMQLSSPDHKFHDFCSALDDKELSLVGVHPYNPAQPLSVGVTVDVLEISTLAKGLTVLTVKGQECLEVQNKPWWDAQQKCFLANVELMVDDQTRRLSKAHQEQVQRWFDEIPKLLVDWTKLMVETKRATMRDLQERASDLDPIDGYANCAYATASLLNPAVPYDSNVCLEIRPALLACRNDYDRLYLVHTALQASLQQLKANLF
jgi:hypothetical protein